MKKIQFKGDNYFLSGSFYSRFKLEGYKYQNSVSAFLSYKDQSRRSEFENLSPNNARKLAATIEADEDWEEYKLHYLYRANLAKFEQDLYWQKKLLEIDVDELPEEGLGRILRLVYSTISHRKNLDKRLKEQEPDFHYDILMEILTQPEAGD